MTALPTFNAGTEPTAGQWQTLLPIKAIKSVDQTVNNSSTLVNDNALVVPVAASATYWLRAHMVQNSGATPGFKLALTLPAGATWYPGTFICGSSSANFQFGDMTSATITGITGAGADAVVDFATMVVISSTSGNVQIQWAQNTANASNTIVRAGSYLILQQVA